MKSIKKVRDTPQTIDTILHSFEKYALGDIRYAKPKPVATFILSICFIEQLSTFLYKFHSDDSKKPERFFEEYMEEYKGINLYHKARHSLVHNYSSRGNFDIDNRGNENVPYVILNDVIHLNTDVFVHYLEIAFEKVKIALSKVDEEPYQNALEASTYYPVLVDTYQGQ